MNKFHQLKVSDLPPSLPRLVIKSFIFCDSVLVIRNLTHLYGVEKDGLRFSTKAGSLPVHRDEQRSH